MAKVLLVIGNGFDLLCGLKSSFPNYLSSDYYKPFIEKIKEIDRTITKDITLPSDFDGFSIYDDYDLDFDDDLTFWDLYYGLPHIYEMPTINEWYNFEDKLRNFAQGFNNNSGDYRRISDITMKPLQADSHEDKEYKRLLILYLYQKKHGFDLGGSLFEQLKFYEKRFGEYIKTQQSNFADYEKNALLYVGEMIDKGDEIAYINNFNYSDLSFITKDIWHVNGDVNNPIFGIDENKIDLNNNWHYYSKTYRRLELTGSDLYSPRIKEYSKVIVCGHSLNEQDYSYFYSLFNTLHLDKDRTMTRRGYYVEFVYYKYGNKSSKEVRNETISRVIKILNAYNNEILREPNFRLIDILFSAGAIRFKEIDNMNLQKR